MKISEKDFLALEHSACSFFWSINQSKIWRQIQLVCLVFYRGKVDLLHYVSFMCPTLFFHFCIHCSTLTTQFSFLPVTIQLILFTYFSLPLFPFPSGHHYSSVLCIYVCLGLFTYVPVFYIPHVSKITWYLSSFDLFHLAYYL